MREWWFFCITLGSGAMLTAWAVLHPSQSTFWYWVFWIGAVVCFTASIAILYDLHFIKRAGPKKPPELSIVIGHDGHYIETQNHNLYNAMKTVRVGIRNAGDSYLSNCKVYLQTTNPATNTPEQWLREDTFSLNPGEERFVSIAAFNEPLPPQPASATNLIRPSYPPSGTFWHPPMIQPSGGFITITAVSAESRPCESICRLWVEDNKLHWEKV